MKNQPIATGLIDPSLLQPNPWNSNTVSADNEIKLEESIKKFGMFKPIIVRRLPDGSLQILGGEHRAQAAARLGLQEVPYVNLGEIDDTKAKEIGLVDNGRYGADDTLALAAILKDLNVEDLTTFMPISSEEINNIFSSSEIDLDSLELLSVDDPSADPAAMLTEPLASGKVAKTHTIMRFKVTTEDAEAITEKINHVMKLQGFIDDDSLTNAGHALIHLLQENDE